MTDFLNLQYARLAVAESTSYRNGTLRAGSYCPPCNGISFARCHFGILRSCKTHHKGRLRMTVLKEGEFLQVCMYSEHTLYETSPGYVSKSLRAKR